MITDTTNVYLFTSIKLMAIILMHKRTMISKHSCICVTRATCRMFMRIINNIYYYICVKQLHGCIYTCRTTCSVVIGTHNQAHHTITDMHVSRHKIRYNIIRIHPKREGPVFVLSPVTLASFVSCLPPLLCLLSPPFPWLPCLHCMLYLSCFPCLLCSSCLTPPHASNICSIAFVFPLSSVFINSLATPGREQMYRMCKMCGIFPK